MRYKTRCSFAAPILSHARCCVFATFMRRFLFSLFFFFLRRYLRIIDFLQRDAWNAIFYYNRTYCTSRRFRLTSRGIRRGVDGRLLSNLHRRIIYLNGGFLERDSRRFRDNKLEISIYFRKISSTDFLFFLLLLFFLILFPI